MLAVYFAVYMAAFVYWEVFMRLEITGSITRSNIGLLFFIPAEAVLFAALCGVHKNHIVINKIVMILLAFIPAVYYATQFIYYRIFGSVISVSMLGMGGDAIGNFGWALKGVIISSLGYLGIILFPVLLITVFTLVKFPRKDSEEKRSLLGEGYSKWLHLVALVLVALLWYGGIQGLRLLGTERGSAYYVLNDPLSDTDTTSERIGTLATSIVETGSIYFGLGGGGEDISVVAVNEDALMLGEVTDASENEEASVSDVDTADANAAQTPAEEEFIPVPHLDQDLDFDLIAANTTDKNIISLCEYFGSKRPTKTNEYTGIFEGYNLIYICGEAFSNYGIDPDITPTLYKMATNGIVLNNFYNSFPNTTTNGEYAFATSYWPDISRWADSGTVAGSFAQSASTFMPYGLGDFFKAQDVDTYAFHNYYGNYYWRDHSWPNLGYDNIKFMGSGMTFTTTWPASDLELFEQSVDDYISDERFHTYYMTFSGHGPYNSDNRMYRKNIDAVKELAGDKYTDNAILGYFCGEYELELGMEYLLDRLDKAGQLEKTVIVLIGDHFPYFLPESAKQELNGGEPMDETFEMYHSTCIIYNAGLEEPIVNDEYCCNVDILPTILNLFDIEYDSRLLMGTDVFSSGVHRARLYNGSFITDYVRYDKRSGKKIWSKSVADYSEKVLENYFEAMLDYTESEYTASLQALKNNFWLYVWKNAGFLTEEEVSEELAREQIGKADYDAEAQREAEEALKSDDGTIVTEGEGVTEEGQPQAPAPVEEQPQE